MHDALQPGGSLDEAIRDSLAMRQRSRRGTTVPGLHGAYPGDATSRSIVAR
jgi:hypothetical protein